MSKLLRLAGRLVTLGLVVAAIWAIINHQRVVDYITVWYTQTPASVIGLVERAGMNQQGGLYLPGNATRACPGE